MKSLARRLSILWFWKVRSRFFGGIRYRWFCILWLWANRTWLDTRKKYKTMNRAWLKHEEGAR